MSALEPDRGQIEMFVEAIFRHAAPQGFVAIRSFFEGDASRPARLSHAALSGGLRFVIDVAEDDARRAAQHPRPVVFCPPLAIFAGKDRARERDIAEGLALSVECDERPLQARAALEAILGPATVVVESGGRWMNGGAPEDKLHLHWRLATPACGADLKKLKQARDLAARIVGGDPSNKPVCHPIRWPGSWHRKAEPRLCELAVIDPDREIKLEEALSALIAAAPRLGEGRPAGRANDAKSGRRPDEALIPADTLKAIRNGVADGQRSDVFFNVMVGLERHGFTAGDALALLEEHPNGIAEKYVGRLQHEVERVFDKLKQYHEGAGDHAAATPAGGPGAASADLGEWDAGDDVKPPSPRGWLLSNVFCRSFLSSLIAEGGTGKTAVRYAQYLALATGRELTGEHIFQRSRCLIVSLEDDDRELRRRIFAARLYYGIDAAEVRGWLFLSAPGAAVGKLMAMDPRGRTAVRGTLAAKLEAVIKRRKIDLLAIDPFVKAHGVPENDNSLVDLVAQVLTDLAHKYDIAVDFAHHVKKGPAEPGNADRGRGASAARDAARLVYSLATMTSEEANAFGIPDHQRRSYIRMDSAKVNVAPSMAKAKWFFLTGVPLDNGTELYPHGDVVQTVAPWSPPETSAGLDTDLINRILDAIDAGLPDGQRYTDAPSATTRAAWRVVKQHAPQKSEAQAREIIRTWVKNKMLVSEPWKNPVTRQENTRLRVGGRPGDIAT
jgi:hypothetical protein